MPHETTCWSTTDKMLFIYTPKETASNSLQTSTSTHSRPPASSPTRNKIYIPKYKSIVNTYMYRHTPVNAAKQTRRTHNKHKTRSSNIKGHCLRLHKRCVKQYGRCILRPTWLCHTLNVKTTTTKKKTTPQTIGKESQHKTQMFFHKPNLTFDSRCIFFLSFEMYVSKYEFWSQYASEAAFFLRFV